MTEVNQKVEVRVGARGVSIILSMSTCIVVVSHISTCSLHLAKILGKQCPMIKLIKLRLQFHMLHVSLMSMGVGWGVGIVGITACVGLEIFLKVWHPLTLVTVHHYMI